MKELKVKTKMGSKNDYRIEPITERVGSRKQEGKQSRLWT